MKAQSTSNARLSDICVAALGTFQTVTNNRWQEANRDSGKLTFATGSFRRKLDIYPPQPLPARRSGSAM